MAPQGHLTLADLATAPPPADQPVQLGPRLWWVGHHLHGTPCHAYLLEQGDQSVLVDPGSALTLRHTLHKVAQVVPLAQIRWFVCHHQDPDIAGAMPLLDQLITRDDARLVTHRRAAEVLQHLGLELPCWLVEEHGWVLPLDDRTLRFVFTPYAPGAFTTFDPGSGTLMSSELFGAQTRPRAPLLAQDLGHFNAMRPFHERLIPCREILTHAVDQVLALPVTQVAPQHGCVIPEPLVRPLLQRLRQLECGLYLLTDADTSARRLTQLNDLLRKLTQTLLDERDFKTIVGHLQRAAAEVMPVEGLEFYVPLDDGQTLRLCPEERFRGAWVDLPEPVAQVLRWSPDTWHAEDAQAARALTFGGHAGRPGVLVPLFLAGAQRAGAVVVVRLQHEVPLDQTLTDLLDRLGPALEVAVEREALHRSLERERDKLYERSIRDPLTGLYTRRHLHDVVTRWTDFQDRDDERMISVIMFDLDHFKRVNDTWGHPAGDAVLKRVAAIIQEQCRGGDLPVRMGGEEFGLFLFGDNPDAAPSLAARVAAQVRAARFEGELSELRLTLSAGTTCRQPGEPLDEVIARADEALYAAKAAGRDRVETR